ncbi:MAG: biopolymer transporter ExbD [Salinivirgaceae bacterium]|nr:biopolymer transporter ExbD [Salinivirgaceae bacterium]MDD4746367.1 biopolymer transporter ExbD [Salinivirgaceae bacterium]
MARQEQQEINAGSMADIAFLLLIFFLVTTTMDVDSGMARVLPPMPEENQKLNEETKIKERNIFIVLINKSDRLLVNGKDMDIKDLRAKAKEFIENPHYLEDLPELDYKPILVANPRYVPDGNEPKKIPHKHFEKRFPDGFPVSKGIISLQNDRGTSYKRYIEVQNELVAAYNELRTELSMREFGKSFAQLLDQADVDAIRVAIPQKISEAEPKNIGGK